MNLERKSIIVLLNNLGVPAHVKGYNYLIDAVELCEADPTIRVTKEMYVVIARQYNDTPSRVERAMRHAIELAWQRCDLGLSDAIFSNSISSKSGKPTNAQFCKTLANHLKYNL